LKHLEFLLEEASMQNVLEDVLSRLVSNDSEFTWRCHPYNGKENLIRRLPNLLHGYSKWITDEYHIIIVIDRDQDDCHELKQRIVDMCNKAGLSEQSLVRIVVVMLESWFFGDPKALEAAFPRLKQRRIGDGATYRNPEERPDPARDLDREMREVGYKAGYRKLAHSRAISPHLNLEEEHNRSHSFNVTLQALKLLLN
jgi:hypothetical protein